jgi:hypothetical protein
VDGRVAGEVIGLFTSMPVSRAVGTKRARRGFTGWTSGQVDVQHSLVGGITSHKATIQAFHQSDEPVHASKLSYVVGHGASTVLSVMEGSCRYRQVPPN